MKKWLLWMAMMLPAAGLADSAPAGRDCVVLLHGLGRTAWSMHRLEKALQQAGYLTWNRSYPSRHYPVEELVQRSIPAALDFCRRQRVRRVHFVTHSLGGILVRQWLQDQQVDVDIGRVVMLGPPNHGSEVVDRFRRWPLFRWVVGPAGLQLGTQAHSLPNRLGPARVETGIIAGSQHSDPWFDFLFTGQHDGKVSVASTRLEGMDDFVVLPAGHTFMAWQRRTINQVLAYLARGEFLPANRPG